MGNSEFLSAENATRAALTDMNMPEIKVFLDEFLDSFSMTLDEQRQIKK